ncbi:hypothetical protein DSO57_1010571 [Entomophthora muscae]|uniref:Uncharacterized protein n=1 Tax=Entomophthora muscae TaxID=34485 RepID=A0ACC2THE3_9FUNG|nr:hypothetical protein DSO57_1010571 [Entomophthora muscae]
MQVVRAMLCLSVLCSAQPVDYTSAVRKFIQHEGLGGKKIPAPYKYHIDVPSYGWKHKKLEMTRDRIVEEVDPYFGGHKHRSRHAHHKIY